MVPIPERKWEVAIAILITKLPKIVKQNDSIIVVDKLIKTSHFIPVKTTHKETNIAKIYMNEVGRLHGVPKAIISHRDPKFTSNFWKGFGINLNLNTTYHLESDGKTERTNKIIEDIVRMCVMDQSSKWEDYIHLVEFDYNNGYQASLKMSPFEALYGRKCNTPMSWDNPTYRVVLGPDLLKQMEEQMTKIK
jgi:hypothetical protein